MIQQTSCKERHTHAGTEYVSENDVFSETDWQQWQTSYGARRRKTFTDIVEALKKHLISIL